MLRRFLSKKGKDYTIEIEMSRLARVGIAWILLPACYGVLQGLWTLARQFKQAPGEFLYFIYGFLGYGAFQGLFFKPIRTYVFGHELTHAMAAWLSGGHVKHFNVSKHGGSVSVTKSNLLVALAPYFIPLYSLILWAAYFVADSYYDLARYRHQFLGILGASLGFHFALTIYALRQDQPDLKLAGKLLSGVLIFLGNSFCLVFLLGTLFPKTVSWRRFLTVAGRQTLGAYERLGRGGEVLWTRSQEFMQGPHHHAR